MQLQEGAAWLGSQRGLFVSVILLAMAVVSSASLPSAAKTGAPAVREVNLSGDLHSTTFAADITSKIEFSVFTLEDPYRVVIELPEVAFRLPADRGRRGRGLVSAFHFGLFTEERARIVLELVRPVRIARAAVEPRRDGQGARLVLELAVTDPQSFAIESARHRSRREQTSGAKPGLRRSIVPSAPRDGRNVIILDAGHGGIDSGAISPNGTLEKNIVLAFAELLREKLEAHGGFVIEMTRTSDVYVPLGERVALAQDKRGDLFVSIHADSIPQRFADQVRGATVYTLSHQASDRLARQLAVSENRSDIVAGVVLPEASGMVNRILVDLLQRETKVRSRAFAQAVLDKLDTGTLLNKRPHRSAAFHVLKAPDVPSVLLELGYLSNAEDERLLKSPSWRNKVAKRLVKAIEAYFAAELAELPF